MSKIIRGTTPTNTFHVNVDLTEAEEIILSYAQKGSVVINKTLSDIDVTEDTLRTKLTQSETLKLDSEYDVEIQCRALFNDGTAIATDTISVDVGKILYEGVI